jgi:hypothetical protein
MFLVTSIMSKLISVKTENDVEFYVSNNGKQTGMSLAGLARCCGVHQTTISKFLNTAQVLASAAYKVLNRFNGNHFIDTEGTGLEVDNNTKVVRSEVCSAVIGYYALESKHVDNTVACQTLLKFADIGIECWIKKVIGFEPKMEPSEPILDQLALIFEELQELKQLAPLAKNYLKVKDGVKTEFPGLTDILNNLEDDEIKVLPGKKITLSDWLFVNKKIRLSKGGYSSFGRMVSETYKSMKQEEPKKGNRKKANGKWSMNVRLYGENDFPILEAAFKQFVVAL